MLNPRHRSLQITLLLLLAALLIGCDSASLPDVELPSIELPSRQPADEVNASAVKFLIEETGVYRLSLKQLQQAGLEIDALSAETLNLSTLGTDIPYLIDSNGLIFYGNVSESRYSRYQPYILRSGAAGTQIASRTTPALASPIINSVMQTVRLENNWHYEQRAAEFGGDVWFWERILDVGDQSIFELPIELASVAQEGSADIELAFWGFTYNNDVSPDHDFTLAINDFALEPVAFDGQTYYTHQTAIPSQQLTVGENKLVIDNSEIGQALIDQVYLNWVALNYPVPTSAINDALIFTGEEGQITMDRFSAEPIILDVSDPLAPKQLSEIDFASGAVTFGVKPDMHIAAVAADGFREVSEIAPLLASDLRDAGNSAELLIVTTKELAPALQPLVEAREAEGLSVKVARVDELYDEFGHGAVSPDAITEFVKYAVENWAEPKPRYLFVVGDTTTDMLGHGERLPKNPIPRPKNIVPSPIVQVSSAGETVADARLTDLDGDLKPDLAVGRWPVDSVRDVRNLVERTLAYEAGVSAENALFTFDGTSSEFSGFTERLIEQSAFPQDHALLFDGPTSSQVTEEWNNGSWLVSYVGHGSLNMWGAEEVLTIDAVDQLGSSSNTPPIVLQFSCLTGQFAYPQSDSISERMLKSDDGPVLLVASTSLTLSAHQAPFATALVESLQDPSTLRVGDALQYAKEALQINGNLGLQEISDTFGLIGDPSAKIVRPDLFAATVNE